jgi:NAD(P)-dependent dehydrogenase (short-subunit alcohol dehydrogenase family)
MLQMDVTDEQSVFGVRSLSVRAAWTLWSITRGSAAPGPANSHLLEEAKRQIDVNLFGAFRVCRAVVPTPTRNSRGGLRGRQS